MEVKKQPTVTMLTTESELLSLSSVGSELIAWRRLFIGLAIYPGHSLPIWCDKAQTVNLVMKQARVEDHVATRGHP